MKHDVKYRNGQYEVTIDGKYLTISVDGYPLTYQIKLEDEGLVLDFCNETGFYAGAQGTYFFNDECLAEDA